MPEVRRLPALLVAAVACGGERPAAPPDPDGWGLHILAEATAPDGSVWRGTYGHGVYIERPGAPTWEHLVRDSTGTSIPGDYVHAVAFQGDTVWLGTLGNGWGASSDRGRTWRTWTVDAPGAEYRYVAPNGIVVRGDTVYIATTDGITLTWDGGMTWRVMTDAAGAVTATDPLFGQMRHQYVLALAAVGARLYVSHVRGVEVSTDGGRTWTFVTPSSNPLYKIRRFLAPGDDPDRLTRFLTTPAAAGRPPLRALRAPGTAPAQPAVHAWLARPIAVDDQPFIDQTCRYGATMGGTFRHHQGVAFNNAAGTAVRAAAAGTVVFAGADEAGALTVAVRHDRRLLVGDSAYAVFSVYAHHEALTTVRGRRVAAGDVIARVGNSGRATHEHLRFEVHAVPLALADSHRLVVDPDQRFPPFATNPELWLAPLPTTGMVAGTVHDEAGRPVPHARIYGFAKPLPSETPFSFVETYDDPARGTPAYAEHFAIGDVPAGDHLLGVDIDGRRVYRLVNVQPGMVSWVAFRP